MSFDEYTKLGAVSKDRPDISRSDSQMMKATNRKAFLQDVQAKIEITEANANYFVEIAFDILLELIRFRLFLEGYKAIGLYAHEAEVSYLHELGFNATDPRFVESLRYSRNQINYYGKSAST
jgi:hypothetical protein